jgi:hypothetical protein
MKFLNFLIRLIHTILKILPYQLSYLRPLSRDLKDERGWLMSEQEQRKRLELLRSEHRDLDIAIEALAGSTDQLQIARLKKRKLQLKDQIHLIEDSFLPDIIA